MVQYHLRNRGLNEAAVIKTRNERIKALLITVTSHRTLEEKFHWVVKELNSDYPNLKFSGKIFLLLKLKNF